MPYTYRTAEALNAKKAFTFGPSKTNWILYFIILYHNYKEI